MITKVIGLLVLLGLLPVHIAFVTAAATTVTLDMNTIILAVIGLLGTTVTGFLALRMATIAADARENKVATVKAADSIEKIHVAVNSGKTAMENQIAGLNKTVLDLSGTIKTLEENKRGSELAKAVASVPASVAAAPAPVGKGKPGKLGDAIADVVEAAEETVVAAEKTVEHAEKVPRKP